MHNLSSRAGAAVVVSSLLLCTSLAAADAASSAQVASAPTTVTSGTWGAVATTNTTAPFGTGPLALTFTLGGPSRQYFNVVNSGTLPLIAESFKITTTAGSAIIEACSTTWTESNGRCPSGAITTVTTSGAGYTSFSVPLPAAGSSVRLRARVTGLQLLDCTVTISVAVTRAQARAAATTGN